MATRTHRETVVFKQPFVLKGIDRILPSGDYLVVTDEDLIEGLSFPAYRRVSTMIFVPTRSNHRSLPIRECSVEQGSKRHPHHAR